MIKEPHGHCEHGGQKGPFPESPPGRVTPSLVTWSMHPTHPQQEESTLWLPELIRFLRCKFSGLPTLLEPNRCPSLSLCRALCLSWGSWHSKPGCVPPWQAAAAEEQCTAFWGVGGKGVAVGGNVRICKLGILGTGPVRAEWVALVFQGRKLAHQLHSGHGVWRSMVRSGTGVSSRGRCQLLPLYPFSDTSLTAWAGSTLLNVFEKAYSLCSSGPDWIILCRECWNVSSLPAPKCDYSIPE